MSEQIKTKARPNDLLKQMGANMYRAAYEKGMSLSAFLELYEDPSEGYNDGTDAFQRLLRAAEVRVEDVPSWGLPASTYEDFNKTDQARALIPEWVSRVYREVQTGRKYSTRDIYQSSDGIPGSWERPYAEAANARWDSELAPAIPVSELIALTTTIDADSYRAYYLQNDTENQSMTRISEGAEVPRVKLVGGEHTIDLYKFGRALEASYEVLRRQRVNKIALHLRRIAVQAEVDKVATIIDVMINGDGNNNAAVSYDLTTLDGDATAGTITLKGWLAFKMQFANPYVMTGALAREAEALQLLTLSTGDANIPLVTIQGASGFGSFSQINSGLAGIVRLGWTDDVPSGQYIVAFDRRVAVERVVEMGANITEIERFTTKQTQTLTMTEVEGYAIIDENAVRVLNVNA